MKMEQDQHTSHSYQLDWRWVERFHELASYDGHGWLAFGGPFTPEEQGTVGSFVYSTSG